MSYLQRNSLRHQGVFILGSSDAGIVLRTKKNQRAKQMEFLWAVLLIGPFRSKEEMNPTPATKTIKRLYFYKV
ncbi:hypothetical protein OAV61_06815 [Flavobacteriaceae bacterium]|nr:hypothetical protein [Flavobacteriaceae bacterium]